jgi:hypothetical protein
MNQTIFCFISYILFSYLTFSILLCCVPYSSVSLLCLYVICPISIILSHLFQPLFHFIFYFLINFSVEMH